MKRFFTLTMLSILMAVSASAAEETLWEGDWNVSWELAEGDQNREWKELGQDDFAAMEAGQKLWFYLTAVGDSYHKYNFDNWSWEALPGHEAEHAENFGFSGDTKVEFIVTQEIKDAIAAGGFAMHGHGYHVAKVTKEVAGGDEPAVVEQELWSGDWNVSWELPEGDQNREWKELGQDDFAAMEAGQKLWFYLTSAGDSYHKYNFDNWSWEALPGHDAEHAENFGFSGDIKVEFIVTQEIKDAIAAGGFAMHGHGYHVVKVTKEVVADPAGISTATVKGRKADGLYYDLKGQRVVRPGKGLYILNGKKVLVAKRNY